MITMRVNPAFSEPQSQWSRTLRRSPSAKGGRRERGASCSSMKRRRPSPPEEGIYPHPQIENPSVHLQLRRTGDENSGSLGRHRSARFGNPNSTGRSLIGWDSCRSPVPGEDRDPSPVPKAFHTSITSTHRGWKR